MNRKNWFLGVRVYIAMAIVLVTAQAWLWSRATYGATNLSTIRLQEVYAWTSLGLLVCALVIGPLTKLAPRIPGKFVLFDARRLLGIGAAWFATLHASISYATQFHWPNPTTLAQVYQQSLGLGVLALLVLALMALTSFDRAMHRLGRWWFRLHRLVYIAALAALAHAFMIGTHAAALGAFIAIAICAVVILGMHIWVILQVPKPTNLQIITITLLTILLAAVINYGLTQHLGYNVLLKGHTGYKP